MAERIYGEIPGNPPGTTYANRREVWARGVHRETQGGISGDATGSESVVVSGGYPDDEDHDLVIVYTGQGGRDPNTGKQVADQTLTHRNLGLARCHVEGLLVRVVRGSVGNPAYSPPSGYRYDGLYRVTDYWQKIGLDSYTVWQFRLVRDDANDSADVETWDQAPHVETTVQRIVRNTTIAAKVKAMHNHTCQVCGLQLQTAAGPYAEAAHIRGLGAPHHGPDAMDNILSLCPNHHVLFDNGGIYIDEDKLVREAGSHLVVSALRTLDQHFIGPEHIKYHRDRYVLSE